MNYRKPSKITITIVLVVFIISGLAITQTVKPANAQQQRAFHFQANAGSTTTTPPQVIIMFGTGSFDTAGRVKGGGIFQIFDSTSPTPKTILASGTWEADNLVSYTEVGTWGELAAGTAVMNINLVLSTGTTQPATLTVFCNLGPAGLFNHNPDGTIAPEGITVTIGGNTLTPVGGLTVFDVLGS
jgi:hypothetical protein